MLTVSSGLHSLDDTHVQLSTVRRGEEGVVDAGVGARVGAGGVAGGAEGGSDPEIQKQILVKRFSSNDMILIHELIYTL